MEADREENGLKRNVKASFWVLPPFLELLHSVDQSNEVNIQLQGSEHPSEASQVVCAR